MEEQKVTGNLKRDTDIMNSLFTDDKMFIVRQIPAPGKTAPFCTIFCLEGMIDSLLISQTVIKPLMDALRQIEKLTVEDIYSVISGIQMSKESDFVKISKAIMSGNCAVFISGSFEAVLIDVRKFELRGVTEPESEKVLRGPREGFIEPAKINLSMVRRRLNSNALKIEEMTMGEYTGTKINLCYLNDRVNKDILAELKTRLGKIHMDGVIDSNYLLEQIRDSPMSPFKTVGQTERPDVVAAKLLEGRIAIIVDGSPCALTVPHLFIELFQVNNDYYTDHVYGTINRILRIFGFFLTISVPAVYISIVSFQREVIPRILFLSLATSRQGVPFPGALEAAVLLLVFDILRQASLSMPSSVAQTLSIVGALILGQAAVQAKLVSAPLVIVVALSGTTSMLIPKASNAVIICRAALFLMSTVLGLYGFMLGIIIFIVHVSSLRSFGISYISSESSQGLFSGDILTRARWGKLKYRRLFKHPEKKLSKEE